MQVNKHLLFHRSGLQLAQEIREHYMQLIPLTGANTSVIEALNDIQAEVGICLFKKVWYSACMVVNVVLYGRSQLQCCGLDQGYQDWGYNISEACLCAEDADNPCVSITLQYITHT